MKDFGLYRYNMFQEKGHWFPGNFPTASNLKKVDLANIPKNIPVIKLIEETHRELYRPKQKKSLDRFQKLVRKYSAMLFSRLKVLLKIERG